MEYINKVELRRLIELKNDLDEGKVDVSIVNRTDIEALNILYQHEIENLDKKIDIQKNELDEIYLKMEKMLNTKEG